MQGFDIAQADGGVEVAEDGGEGGRRAQVVAGSEEVARVEADADAGLVVDEGDDGGEVGEGGADDGAGAGHGFEEWRYGGGGGEGAAG